MLKYLLFNHIVCMEKKKKNSSLKQNCRPRWDLSHRLSMKFPLLKNLYQDHELVKAEFNASVVCWMKVKNLEFFHLQMILFAYSFLHQSLGVFF